MAKKKTKKKITKAELKTQAWRLRLGDNSKYVYRLQANGVSDRAFPGLETTMRDWHLAAEQVIPPGDLFVWQREFINEDAWITWAKNFPYPLVEISSTSDVVKSIKLGANFSKPRGRPSGSKNKKVAKKQKTCGVCGKKGHNARTCPKKK